MKTNGHGKDAEVLFGKNFNENDKRIPPEDPSFIALSDNLSTTFVFGLLYAHRGAPHHERVGQGEDLASGL